MKSDLIERLHVTEQPIAVLLSNEKPENAMEAQVGKRACVVPFILAAARGKTVVLERDTVGCPGGKVGLGFGKYVNYPDGIEYFLSTGKPGVFEGECYKKTPTLATEFIETMPYRDIPFSYVIFKPLAQALAQQENPALVIFYVNVNQLSALTVLANYGRQGRESVTIPFAAGCQSVVLLPLVEAEREEPRAVVGMADITVRPMLALDKVSFTVPFSMFEEMEQNAAQSFLGKGLWDKVIKRMEKG